MHLLPEISDTNKKMETMERAYQDVRKVIGRDALCLVTSRHGIIPEELSQFHFLRGGVLWGIHTRYSTWLGDGIVLYEEAPNAR